MTLDRCPDSFSSPRRRIAAAVLLAAGLGAGIADVVCGQPPQPPGFELTPRPLVVRNLRQRIELAVAGGGLQAGGERIYALTALPQLYEQRLFQPLWSDAAGPLPLASELLEALRQAREDALCAQDYHLDAIEALLDGLPHVSPLRRAGQLADLDLLLTDAFLIYGAHLVSGRVDPESFDPEWIATRREVDLVQLLRDAASDGHVLAHLQELRPDAPAYAWLRAALNRYRAIAAAGGWPELSPELTLEPGARAPEVELLRRHLAARGDLASELAQPQAEADLFDQPLVAALLHFQQRHGLEPDGRLGKKTVAALNVSAAERVRQIELNLERWRWLPQDLGARYILVNIPDFSLRVVEQGQQVLAMKVIVGKSYRRTPVFSDTMRYLVINPYWEVPPRLAVEDKLPEIRKDVDFLSRNHIRVLRGWGSEEAEVDPKTVDWARLGKGNFPYRLRQDPGPQNALGQVKFMFPNKFDVYLHDTPSRELFRRTERDASSGCIRVEKPVDLADYLLQGVPGWSHERLLSTIASGREMMVPLPAPIQVHLLYWTTWADEQGTVHFRRDLYGRDNSLDAALRAVDSPACAGGGRA